MSHSPIPHPSTPGEQQPLPVRGGSWQKWVLIGCGGCLALTVVGGIVLVAALFPVFGRARLSAQKTSCMLNLKQLASGMSMYSQEYDEMMPPADRWETGIFPFVRVSSVSVCPTAPELQHGYAFNQRLGGQPNVRVAVPADTGMLFDSGLGLENGNDDGSSFMTRHMEMGNVAFHDGHVKSVKSPPNWLLGSP